MEVKLSELKTGDRFQVNGSTYVKTDEVKVSCCRSINCYLLDNNSQKAYFAPNTVVAKIDG
jgi:hypothetical protein